MATITPLTPIIFLILAWNSTQLAPNGWIQIPSAMPSEFQPLHVFSMHVGDTVNTNRRDSVSNTHAKIKSKDRKRSMVHPPSDRPRKRARKGPGMLPMKPMILKKPKVVFEKSVVSPLYGPSARNAVF